MEITEKHWLYPKCQCLNDPSPFDISMFLTTSYMSTTMFFLCESILSESIAVVIGMEGMASVRRNVQSLNSSLCR